MNTLSLLQPWAFFAVNAFKQWETRSWRRECFGPLLIHASKANPPGARELYYRVRAEFGDAFFRGLCVPFDELPRGCVVGQVDYNCVTNWKPKLTPLEALLGDFSAGRWFWHMENAIAFSKPLPAKGRLGIWNFDMPCL